MRGQYVWDFETDPVSADEATGEQDFLEQFNWGYTTWDYLKDAKRALTRDFFLPMVPA